MGFFTRLKGVVTGDPFPQVKNKDYVACTRKYKKRCRCKKCFAEVRILEFECGCIKISLLDNYEGPSHRHSSCNHCTDFEALRKSCNRPGHPDMLFVNPELKKKYKPSLFSD